MSIKTKYPIYLCIWDDAESDASWTEVPVVPLGPTLAVTLGFLVANEKDYILIADSYFKDVHSKVISGTTKIPRGMVVELTEIIINKKKENAKKEAALSTEAPNKS